MINIGVLVTEIAEMIKIDSHNTGVVVSINLSLFFFQQFCQTRYYIHKPKQIPTHASGHNLRFVVSESRQLIFRTWTTELRGIGICKIRCFSPLDFLEIVRKKIRPLASLKFKLEAALAGFVLSSRYLEVFHTHNIHDVTAFAYMRSQKERARGLWPA